MPMFKVRIAETGECFPCDSAQSVLEGMVQIGRRGIPTGCRGGACGVCRIEVLSGSFAHKAMSRSQVSEADQRDGRVLACRIFPGSDLELKVLGGMRCSVLQHEAGK
ncbi:MAG TPA: 2Fe-2S iron-sulfur cluster-binding protein [Azonexus sp.]|nr:2Fe-2S iron-sulfur cluster-binding protein [Azonexus sp.]